MRSHPRAWWPSLLLVCALLQGCASPSLAGAGAPDPRDPWEGMNRQVFAFNDTLDAAVVKPVARLYVQVVPSPVRTGVRNFIGNLVDVWSSVNAGLQFKGQAAAKGAARVVINTTLGLYGILDIASEMGLEKRTEDFGQTLGHWGFQSGPYIVLPLLGPSTVRDTLALTLDMQASPAQFMSGSHAQTAVTVLRITDARASLLKTGDALQQAALDPYSFVRDAWLQKRENDVYDGNPPPRFDYTDPDAP